MQKLKKGDKVVVLTGRDKGKQGEVLRVINSNGAADTMRVVIEGVNIVKKHMKPNPSKEKSGGIIEKEASMHFSNVAIVNPATNKADKVGFKFLEDGKKVRYFKTNNEMIDIT